MRFALFLSILAGLLLVSPVLAQDVSDAELNGEIRIHAGRSIAARDLQVVTGDVTCDGQADKVAGFLDRDNPDGRSFQLVIVAREESQLVSESVTTFFDSADQMSFCGNGETPPKISLEPFTEEDARDLLGMDGVCPVAIILEDGMCDLHHYFWLLDWDGEEKLVFFRN